MRSTIIRDIFENQTILSWQKGENKLHLFLDNLDTGILRVDTITSLLIDQIKKFERSHIQRLALYIACRTGMWPVSFERELEQIWDNEVIGIYELTHLRKKEVIEAAKANGLDERRFLGEIDRKNVVPFAIKPITLNFLRFEPMHQQWFWPRYYIN